MIVIHIVDGTFGALPVDVSKQFAEPRSIFCVAWMFVNIYCENKEDSLMEFESRWRFVRVWLKLLF